MSANWVIALDQGSSSSKAIVLSPEGKIEQHFSILISTAFGSDGVVEQDPAEVLNSVQVVLRQAIGSIPGSNVAHLAIACQRSSCLAFNSTTRSPLSPIISWRDTRFQKLAQHIAISKGDEIFKKAGLRVSSAYAALKIAHLQKQYCSSSEVVSTLDSFLLGNLIKHENLVSVETLAARTLLLDVGIFQWDDELCEVFDVDKTRLLPIVPTRFKFGSYTGDCIVRACIGDQQAAYLGARFLDQDVVVNLGTLGSVCVATGGKFRIDERFANSILISDSSSTEYYSEASFFPCGRIVDLILEKFPELKSIEDIDRACWKSVDHSDSCEIFAPLGAQNSPDWVSGLPNLTSRVVSGSASELLVPALMRNIAHFVLLNLSELRFSEFIQDHTKVLFGGGISKSTYLTEYIRSISELDCAVCNLEDLSAFGAATLLMESEESADNELLKMILGRSSIIGSGRFARDSFNGWLSLREAAMSGQYNEEQIFKLV